MSEDAVIVGITLLISTIMLALILLTLIAIPVIVVLKAVQSGSIILALLALILAVLLWR